MAKTWRNTSSTVTLKGFEDFYEKLQNAAKDGGEVDRIAEKTINQAADNIYNTLKEKAEDAGLSSRLVSQIEKDIRISSKKDWYYAEVGWKKVKPSKPLPDVYKVMYLNYGTPSERHTKKGGQRIKINGKWVTLGTKRGIVEGKGFIKKAKLAANRKNQALFKKTLKDIIGEL